MQLDLIGKEGSTDRAVSPVIGVILMVAITVILAAVIGTFVLDLGQDVGDSAPQASISVSASASANTITLNHRGGDALHSESTRVIVEAGSGTTTFEPMASSNDQTLTVGNEATITAANSGTNDTVNWDGTGVVSGSSYEKDVDGATEFSSGSTVSVTLVDTTSQKVIFETEITV